MIEFFSLEDFQKAGLAFDHLLDKAVFNYLLFMHGFVYFDPVRLQICDRNKLFMLRVKRSDFF